MNHARRRKPKRTVTISLWMYLALVTTTFILDIAVIALAIKYSTR